MMKKEEQLRTGTQASDEERNISFGSYFFSELTHGYELKDDKHLYSEKQRRITTFMKTPRELEKLMLYGFFICLDAFLFVFTFLPLRVLMAAASLLYGILTCSKQKLKNAQVIDIIRASIFGLCIFAMGYIDTSALYHVIRAQSVIKLYVIYNMLEIFDRLLASIGQDTLDTLFWLAAGCTPIVHYKAFLKTSFYFFLAVFYVFIHSNVILVQATTLTVAINSHSKALLTIMISNNFVELKGSVFKKFEINNLFQMSCSDIRERFHYVVLMFVILLRNFSQSGDMTHLQALLPIVFSVILSEIFVDCVKHAFITKFNDISPDVYTRYRQILSEDMTVSRSSKANSEHSDLVSRRIGFIPLPLGCILCTTISQSVNFPHGDLAKLLVSGYISLVFLKITLGVVLLRTAWKYYDSMKKEDKKKDEHVITSPELDILTYQGRIEKPWTRMKSKSLTDIERFTLCSNRII